MLASSFRVPNTSLLKLSNYLASLSTRNVRISVIGAGSDIGSHVALLLKLNKKVTGLQLYDDEDSVKGVGLELAHIPGGPTVSAFVGDRQLGTSLKGSHIIVMTSRTARKPGRIREEMMADNALPVQWLCRSMVDNNPNAFLAISTNPINCIIPFVSALLCKYNCYNPCKVLGITHIDTARCKALIGNTLQIDPRSINVPVIGGHSDDTIIPLFSNVTNCYPSLACHANTLTRVLRKAGTAVIFQKQGTDSATLSVAWSIHEFIDGLINAICGYDTVLNCYTVNPHFGTRFFSGPATIGCNGIKCTCYEFPMNDFESSLLKVAVPVINRDVCLGEDHVRYIAKLGK